MAQGGEKTEQPTPKRLEEGRRKGQVARSRDLSAALAGGAALVVLVALMPQTVLRLQQLISTGIVRATTVRSEWLQTAAQAALGEGVIALARTLAPVLGSLLVLTLLVGLLQTRGLFVPGLIKPDIARLHPKISRVFNPGSLFEVVKGMVLTLLLGMVAWVVVRPWIGALPALSGQGAVQVLVVLGSVATKIGMGVVITTLALGLADYLWQRRRTARGLMMTREEVKREFKESEGDPHHKSERQRLHRELATQRMLADVRKADFVVVNPDHLAVAVRYDRDGDAAPIIVASGENLVAEQIKALAREAGVPIFRDITLARSLRDVPEGDEIPEALFDAVAEILRVVYGMDAATPVDPTKPDGQAPPAPAARGIWQRG